MQSITQFYENDPYIISHGQQHVGISKINFLRLSVSPNPVNDILKIQSEPESKYYLTNHLGMVVKSGTIHNWINFIDITEFSKGLYTLKVINGKRHSSKKIILK